jgi:hypothetical protein
MEVDPDNSTLQRISLGSRRYIRPYCMELLNYLKVKLSLWLTNKVLRHEYVWGSGYTEPNFPDLGTSWEVSGQLHAPVALPQGIG